MRGSVVVLNDRVLSSRPGPGMGMFSVKNLALNIGDCISRESDNHVSVCPILFNWGRKRSIENDMHPSSDRPQFQHIKADLAIMF